jgi:flagellar biosynthesis/type III secretory pathway chaperone
VTSSSSSAASLAAAVRSERAAAQALVEVLTEERELLRKGDTDALTATAARKRELLLHVAHLGEHRKRLLQAARVSLDRQGMQALLATLESKHELHAEWRSFIEITEQARRLNEENGAFIEAGMRANQQALSILTSAASGGTYGPGGHTLNPLSSRPLASA